MENVRAFDGDSNDLYVEDDSITIHILHGDGQRIVVRASGQTITIDQAPEEGRGGMTTEVGILGS